jgi:hypothetical protein
MTVTITPPLQRRLAPLAAHVYTLPVVRELPAQPVDLRDSGTW